MKTTCNEIYHFIKEFINIQVHINRWKEQSINAKVDNNNNDFIYRGGSVG